MRLTYRIFKVHLNEIVTNICFFFNFFPNFVFVSVFFFFFFNSCTWHFYFIYYFSKKKIFFFTQPSMDDLLLFREVNDFLKSLLYVKCMYFVHMYTYYIINVPSMLYLLCCFVMRNCYLKKKIL